MKTAIFMNTFAKMANYDLEYLSTYPVRNIAIVAKDEYQKFSEAYKQYFSAIHPCPGQLNDPLEKASYNFCSDIIKNEIAHYPETIRIISLSEDNLLMAAKLRSEFDIPGMKFETALSFRDKTIMKDVLRAKNIRTPHYLKFNETLSGDPDSYFSILKQSLGLPFVLKPVDLLGGLGISMIRSFREFELFCKTKACYSSPYEAEEFISGSLFHCDSIRKNNETLFSVCCEYTNPNFDFQKGKSVVSIPLPQDNPLASRIFAFNESVLQAMKLDEGISHHELFLTDTEDLVFLEIAARSPGAIITPMYRRAFNIGFEDIDFKMQMDIPFALLPSYDTHYMSGIFPLPSGTVKELVQPSLASNHEMNWLVKQGEETTTSQSLRDKSAYIMAWNKSYDTLRSDFDFLRNFESVLLE